MRARRCSAWIVGCVALGTLAACANGGGAELRGGDGGPSPEQDGGAGALDAGSEPDAGASSTDAGSGSPDAGGAVDSGLRDAGLLDSGPRDAGRDSGPLRCTDGTTMSCTTSCGTTGSSRCTAGTFSVCAGPAESCNGADDDCDSSTDEGFRASVVRLAYSSALRASHAGCDGTTQRSGPECNAAIHRYCAARGCTTSGFGPDENDGDAADVTCVIADVRGTTYTTLSGHHAGCTTATVWGPECNAAIHRYCVSVGFPSGFGPVEHAGDGASVACVRSAVVIGTTYTELSAHHPPCNGTTERMGPNCNAAIHRFCIARGHASGFGPVESDGDTAFVSCVRN